MAVRVGEKNSSVPARVVNLAGVGQEKIAVLELQTAFPDPVTLKIRFEPLVPEEELVSLAYPGGALRTATGRFVRYGSDDDGFAGSALLEMHDGNDRLVLDHGASGAPVLDCHGRVVAVVAQTLTQSITILSTVVRTSTPWRTPNVVALPTPALRDFSQPQ